MNYLPNENKTFCEWIKENENKWISAGIIVGCIAIAMPFIVYFSSGSTLTADSFAKLGTVGDFLGGTTVGLLSLASILFLISTIVMQRKELGMQREELQMTREELAKSNEQYRITNKTMKLQQFETTFFNMINLYNEVLKDVYHPKKDVKGREALKAHYDSINNYYHSQGVVLFVELFLASNRNDYKARIKSFGEVVFCLLANGDKTEQDFQIWDFKNTTSIDEFHKLIEQTKQFRDLQIKSFDYESIYNLSSIIPDNLLVKEFMEEYAYDDSYKKEAFSSVREVEDYMLENYIKIIKMIIQFVDNCEDLIEGEKRTYVQIFISQLSMIETTMLSYYMKLDNDQELFDYQEKYLIISFNSIYKNSLSI